MINLKAGKTKFNLSLVLPVLLLFVFSINGVMAAPPFSTAQIGSLEILVPITDSIQQNQNYTLEAHVFNTTALLTNATTECFSHLYSSNGVHIDNGIMSYSSSLKRNEFERQIDYRNFSKLGNYCFIIECNKTSQTGGVEGCFTVTPTGEQEKVGFTVILLILAYLILLIGIFTKNIPVTILGGFATSLLGLYTLNYGIDIYRNFATEWISIITMLFGGFWAAKASLEYLEVI